MKLKKTWIYLNNNIDIRSKFANSTFKNLKKGHYINLKFLNLDSTKKGSQLSRLNTITGFFLYKSYNIKSNSFKIKISVLYKTERIIFTCLLNTPYILQLTVLNKKKNL